MAKTYFKSYIWLIETLQSRGPLTLRELQSLWLKSSANDDGKELAPRTLSNHIQSIACIFGVWIECNRSDNTYFIDNEDDVGGDSIRGWMLEALSLSSLISESARIKDRILFEEVPSSRRHLATVIRAMRDGCTLNVKYRSFRKDHDEDLQLEPYCIREFKKRWYLFAVRDGIDKPHIYALDRMLSASVGNRKFRLPKKFDAHALFSGVYGTRIYDDMKREVVKVRADAMQARYFRTLPLHPSQEEVETAEDYSVFSYCITPDYDFRQDILSFGAAVEVLEPEHLRNEMKETINQLNNKYNG